MLFRATAAELGHGFMYHYSLEPGEVPCLAAQEGFVLVLAIGSHDCGSLTNIPSQTANPEMEVDPAERTGRLQ